MSAPARLRAPTDPLLAAAVRWKALLASGDLSPADQLEFESWQAENIRHTVAADLVDARVAAICDAINEDAFPGGMKTRLDADAKPYGRPLVVASPEHCEPLRTGHNFSTLPGVTLDLVTDDGSYIRLKPSSAIGAAFDDGVWTLDLRCGTAFVSRAQKAPGTMLIAFSTDIGGLLRIEPGTEATIEIRVEEVVCLVAAGRCVVTTDEDDTSIDAGYGSSFNRHRTRPEPTDLNDAFDWVEDRLVAAARPLHAVIDRLRPLSPVPIVVEKALEHRIIDGEYRPRDTQASLRRIADHLKATLSCGDRGYFLDKPTAK